MWSKWLPFNTLMRYLFIRYKKNLYLYIKYELLRLQYKYLFWNVNLPFYLRSNAFFILTSLSKLSNVCRLRNICLFSYKKKSIFKLFHLSRFMLKIAQYKGEVFGFKKYSW